MTVGEMAALLRRQWAAVAVVLVLAAGAMYVVKSSQLSYQDTATVQFVAPKSAAPNPYTVMGNSLITAAEVVVRAMMSPESQRLVRDDGGTATYSVELVNGYNQDYPDYSLPDATVTTESLDPESAHTTYVAVAQQLRNVLASMQEHAGVKPRNRIYAYIAAETGPLVQVGSPKRVYAGLILLTLVAIFMVAVFLDRRPGLARVRLPALGTRGVARRPGTSEP